MPEMVINGERKVSVSGQTLEVINPATGEVFTTIPKGTAEDVNLAVKAARQALSGAWGQLTAVERGRLLLKLSQNSGLLCLMLIKT